MDAPWHTLDVAQALAGLQTSPQGLTRAEAATRLARDGRNELPPPRRTHWLIVLLRQFAGPLIAVLLVAAVIALLMGDHGDAAFIGGVLLFNALIGFAQEVKAEREIVRMFTLLHAKARVEREDELFEIDAAELVKGDIVWLESGDRVPADLRLMLERDASVDEAALTGESTPVSKHLEVVPDAAAIPAERANMLFAGTALTRGRAAGIVVATGAGTELGEVAREIETTRRAKAPLVARIERLSRLLAAGTVAACGLVFALGVARGFGVGETFLIAVALAVAAIPEGLPVAITLALAIGLKRMAARRVLVRRMEAVESLGSCTVICTDKTGTLTLNQLTVSHLETAAGPHEVSGAGYSLEGRISGAPDAAVAALLESAARANEASLARSGDQVSFTGDPTDVALLVAAHKAGIKRPGLLEQSPEVASLPFESERQFAASYSADGRVHVKGAPERVFNMCAAMLNAAGEAVALDLSSLRQAEARLSALGLRLLAVARGTAAPDTPPDRLTLLGLVAMRDAPRPEAADAVAACRDAHVRVLVATGDHASTAMAVANELGIAPVGAPAVTGREIDAMDAAAFERAAREVNVFARVTPAHKLRLVQALQAQGEFVAMTGDGANDAAALKAAHVGVAMGRKGTDVAREAARVVITDDNFASIVAGLEEGRIVNENVRNVVALLVMTGVGEVLAIMICILAGLPVPLSAVQLLWANLVTEGLQVVGLAMEPGEPGILKRPPRPPSERVFNRLMIVRTILVSCVIGMAIALTYGWLLNVRGMSAFAAGNCALLLLVLIENIHIGNCRSESRTAFANSPLRNPWLLGAAILAQAIHLLAMNWGPTQRLLGLEPVSVTMWLALFAISLSVLVVVELHKLAARLTRR